MTSFRFPFQSIESLISMEKELSRNTEPDGALFSVTHRKPASDGEELSRNTEPDGALFSVTHRKPASDGEELYRNGKPAYHDLRDESEGQSDEDESEGQSDEDESEGQSDVARAVRWSDSLVE